MPDTEFKASLVVTRDEPATCTLDITRAPFNTPAKVKGVRIELWELDKSQDTKGKETSRDDLLGTFTVDLAPKRTQGGKRKIEIQFKNFEDPIREPDTVMGILLVNVGQHEQRVKVGMDFGEWPEKKYHYPAWGKARLELGLRIEHGGRTEPMLAQDIKVLQHAKPIGTVGTVVVKDNPKDLFYRHGHEYWKPRSDSVVQASRPHITSLQEITERILGSTNPDWKFEEFNVVSHGSVGLWHMQLEKDNDRLLRRDAVDIERYYRARNGNKEINPPSRLDGKHSRVVIRGCSVGEDKRLMRAISRCFGGVKVYAPHRYYQAYISDRPSKGAAPEVREALFERLYRFVPGSKNIKRSLAIDLLTDKYSQGNPDKDKRFRKLITEATTKKRHEWQGSSRMTHFWRVIHYNHTITRTRTVTWTGPRSDPLPEDERKWQSIKLKKKNELWTLLYTHIKANSDWHYRMRIGTVKESDTLDDIEKKVAEEWEIRQVGKTEIQKSFNPDNNEHKHIFKWNFGAFTTFVEAARLLTVDKDDLTSEAVIPDIFDPEHFAAVRYKK